ncbi:MAG TPA: trypsin-like peptidase domain-containing protein [Cytophagales bacterium]|nr:trypsin-like peptidase domain-containing protein [Cytophagales bacterium]
MKGTIKIIAIAFIAGVLGAYSFTFFANQKNKAGEVNFYKTPPAEFTSYNKDQPFSIPETGDFVGAAASSIQSVVFIKTISGPSYDESSWWDWFFNQTPGKSIASGSGVIFSKDGYIITNNHVIDGAETIEVVHNKRSYVGAVIGVDPSTDLALVKVEAENLPAIKLGKSKDINIGEWVIAVGNPFNLTSTVTAGIVSAKGRNINILRDQFPIESFIQTDAAINPGNSGGALVNANGELIGINTAILSRTGSYNGYGFAVPVDIVLKVVNDLIKYGEVQKAFFGGEVINIDNTVVSKYELKDYDGVLMSYVQTDGAAAKAGIKEGDIILSIDGERIESKSGFDEKIVHYKPGDKINVSYRRNNNVKETTLTLTNIEGTTSLIKKSTFTSDFLGADLEAVPKIERDKLGIENGIRIKKIRTGLMRRLGIEEGFIITAVNKKSIENVEQLVKAFEGIKGRVIIEGMNSRGVRGYYSYIF